MNRILIFNQNILRNSNDDKESKSKSNEVNKLMSVFTSIDQDRNSFASSPRKVKRIGCTGLKLSLRTSLLGETDRFARPRDLGREGGGFFPCMHLISKSREEYGSRNNRQMELGGEQFYLSLLKSYFLSKTTKSHP